MHQSPSHKILRYFATAAVCAGLWSSSLSDVNHEVQGQCRSADHSINMAGGEGLCCLQELAGKGMNFTQSHCSLWKRGAKASGCLRRCTALRVAEGRPAQPGLACPAAGCDVQAQLHCIITHSAMTARCCHNCVHTTTWAPSAPSDRLIACASIQDITQDCWQCRRHRLSPRH